VNPLAAAALAAGELICEFNPELVLVYEALRSRSAEVLSTRHAGRRTVQVREGAASLHLIEGLGASVRVTTLTDCLRSQQRGGEEACTRFAAVHAWHFDAGVYADPDAAFARLPSGAAKGSCEPWRID
jgi:hypothetical protein